jgi:hypothetical protein
MYKFQGEKRRTEIMKCDISEQNNIFYRHEGKKTFIFD